MHCKYINKILKQTVNAGVMIKLNYINFNTYLIFQIGNEIGDILHENLALLLTFIISDAR